MDNRAVLFRDFLLHLHKVKDLADINPYDSKGVPIWQPAKQVTITVDLKGTGIVKIPPPPNEKAYRSDVLNLDVVSVKAFTITYVKNASQTANYYVRKTYYPVFEEKEMKEFANVSETMGKIPDVICQIPADVDSATNIPVVQDRPLLNYLKEPCIKTFMFITEDALRNGIVELNPETCARLQLPKQGMIFDERGQDFTIDIHHYYLVPHGHVLSWPLQVSSEFRRKEGMYAIDYIVRPSNGNDNYMLYYIVANETFKRIYDECVENFFGKIDKRRLQDVGLEIVPVGNVDHKNEPPPVITISLTYIAYPKVTPNNVPVIPSLAPNFYPYQKVLANRIEARRQQEEQRQRTEAQKKK